MKKENMVVGMDVTHGSKQPELLFTKAILAIANVTCPIHKHQRFLKDIRYQLFEIKLMTLD